MNVARMCGTPVPTEKEVAIGLSRTAEERRGRYEDLRFWGVIHTENGHDYYILKTDLHRFGKDGLYERHDHYVVSQDGVKWFLLPPVDEETSARALAITALFSGDVAKTYGEMREEKSEEATEEPQITELQRLRAVVEAIMRDTEIIPTGSELITADGRTVSNPHFQGVAHPEQVTSYSFRCSHRALTEENSHFWRPSYDSFQGQVTMRHLYWLGFVFVYDLRRRYWQSVYSGNGVGNSALAFML